MLPIGRMNRRRRGTLGHIVHKNGPCFRRGQRPPSSPDIVFFAIVFVAFRLTEIEQCTNQFKMSNTQRETKVIIKYKSSILRDIISDFYNISETIEMWNYIWIVLAIKFMQAGTTKTKAIKTKHEIYLIYVNIYKQKNSDSSSTICLLILAYVNLLSATD